MEPDELSLGDLDFSVNGDSAQISSEHPGGAHVLMSDGSVYFVAEATEASAIQAAITRAGGEFHSIGEEDPPAEEELLASEILNQAIEQGGLTRIAQLPPPPAPSPHLDGVDLRELTERELYELANELRSKRPKQEASLHVPLDEFRPTCDLPMKPQPRVVLMLHFPRAYPH